MFKYIFLFFILLTSLLTAMPIINIDANPTKLQEFNLEYFVDKTENMSLDEIKQQDFTPDKSTLSLGILEVDAWLRFELRNQSKKKQKLFIHDEHAYITNTLEFYELKDDLLLSSLKITLANKTDTDAKMYGTDAIFEVSLNPTETKTIYIKSRMLVMQYPHFSIYDEKNSKKRLSKNNTLLFIILGMLLAFAFYHGMLYLATGYKEYVYYTLYLSSAVVWDFFLSGMLANNFGIYFNHFTENFLLSVLFIPIFLILFAKTLFDTKNNYKTENLFLNSVLVLFSIGLMIGIYSVYYALILTSSLYIYMFFIIFTTTISMIRKGNKLALIFLGANTIFSLFMLVNDLYYMGHLNYTAFTFNAASIGIVIEAVILSFLLAYKIRLLQLKELEQSKELIYSKEIQKINKVLQYRIDEEVEKSREKDKILFQQQKLVSMGEMIENIAHQWRQPLSQINSSVLVIDNYLDPNNENSETIEAKLLEIENLTLYMSKTIESFKNFFDPNKLHSLFSIEKIVNSSILILKNSTTKNNITIELNIDDTNDYYGLEDELQQVIIILLNNAKEALIDNRIKDAKIDIYTEYVDSNFIITICDNGGGIDEEIIDKIFDPYFTTKHKSQGTGLGLYISKLIIQENMFGRLSVRNSNGGACFEIELPNKNSRSI